jgi:methionyl-tRNA formyltransferase
MVTAAPLRVAFFGTPAFAVPTLDALLQSQHKVVGVVTRQDRPRGRGHHVSEPPIKTQARAHGLSVLQPDRLADPTFLQSLAAWQADLGVVVAYGKILTEAVLATPKLGLINVHASLLPRYRGAAPVHRAIISGDTETGVTIMRVVRALDAGPMLAVARRPIGPDETSERVENDLATLGASLLVTTVDALAAGSAREEPQDEARSTYAHRLTKEEGLVDWSRTARDIHNLIRGLHPWPHAFTFHEGRRLILLRSILQPLGDRGLAEHLDEPPGTVLDAAGDSLRIATGAGDVGITEIQVEGKRPMVVRDFLAGHRMKPGDRLKPHP